MACDASASICWGPISQLIASTAEDGGGIESLEPLAVHLLQTAHGKALKEEELELRRTDTELRLENSHLKTQLHEVVQQMVHRKDIHMDFRKPFWLTLLVAAVMAGIWVTIYFFHLVAFFAHQNSIRNANRRRASWEVKETVPNFEQCRQEMRERFAFGLRRVTVTRIMLLVLLATASGSYFASRGYFKPLEEKIVPYLYLVLVAVLVGQAVIREVWNRATTLFGPMVETMYKFHSGIQAVAQHLVAQAYLQRHHDEEKSRQQQGMNRAGTNSQDPAEAVRSALCARALFKERGNITGELEVMDTLARAYIRKGESREGLRVAEDYLAAAKKARDKPAEANALLVSASAMASCQQLNDALRVAELARAIYRDLGNAEGLTDAERFAGVVKEALQEVAQHAAGTSNGYPSGAASRGSGPVGAAGNSNAHGLETRGAPRKLGFSMDAGRRDNGRPDDGSLITGQRRQAGPVDPTPLYNRKAFPWTPQQATPKAPQKAGI